MPEGTKRRDLAENNLPIRARASMSTDQIMPL
jgi:hypothetical protein